MTSLTCHVITCRRGGCQGTGHVKYDVLYMELICDGEPFLMSSAWSFRNLAQSKAGGKPYKLQGDATDFKAWYKAGNASLHLSYSIKIKQ